jgi:hypothetical protein
LCDEPDALLVQPVFEPGVKVEVIKLEGSTALVHH